jgi:two-component system sensor histidine kinase AgrC
LFTYIQVFASLTLMVLCTRIILCAFHFKLKDVLTIGALTLVCTLILMVDPNLEPLTGLIALLVLLTLYKLEGIPFIKVLLVCFGTMLLLVLIDAISKVAIILLFQLDSMTIEQLRTDPSLYLMMTLLMYSLGLTSSYVIHAHKDLLQEFKELLKTKHFIFTLIGTFILMFFIFYAITFTTITNTLFDTMVLVISQILILGAVLISVFMFMQFNLKDLRLKAKKTEFDHLSHYTLELETLYDDMRKFKHDYINMLASMASYLEEDNIPALKVIFNEKIIPLGEKLMHDDLRLGRLSYLEQVELKGIISSKCLYAQELGISVFIDIVEPITLDMDIIDLCRVMGIWLDNAIEAARESDNPMIKIGIIKKESTTYVVVSNSVKSMPPLYKLREKGFSTKGDRRGIGLQSVREVLNTYDYIVNDLVFEAGEFRQVLELYDNKKLT